LRRVLDPLEREGASSSVEPMCATKGERQAAQTTKGGRKWAARGPRAVSQQKSGQVATVVKPF
jgi:hypothetical protein